MRLWSVLLPALFALASARAQPVLKYTEFKSGEEMQHSRVACYVQDEHGILWMGTWIGLCRYDGQQFRYFRAEPGNDNPQGSNRIIDMDLDSQGHLWCVANDLKLYRFDRRTSRFTAIIPTLARGEIPVGEVRAGLRSVFCLTGQGATWVVMRDGSLVRFADADHTRHETLAMGYGKTREVYTIQADTRGREWVLTDKGTFIYGGRSVSDYPFSQIAEVDGLVYLAAASGYLAAYDEEGRLRFIDLPQGTTGIARLTPLTNHRLAVSTADGLLVMDTRSGEIRTYTATDDGKPLTNVDMVHEDGLGRLWLFAEPGGIGMIAPDDGHVAWLPAPPGLATGGRQMAFEDEFGTLWVRPLGTDLCYYDEATRALRHHADATATGERIPVGSYNFFFADHQKNLWISSGTRLFRLMFQQRQFVYYPLPGAGEVRALMHDGTGSIWCGDKARGCLCRIDSLTLPLRPRYLTPEGEWSERPQPFAARGIYALMRDGNGIIWVGTRGDGLYRLESRDGTGAPYTVQHFVHLPDDTYSLACNDIYDLYEDECGHIWVATFGGGLNLVDHHDGKIRFAGSHNVMQNYPRDDYQHVRCITGDGHGHLLAGTSNGLLTFTAHAGRPGEIVFHRHAHQAGHRHSLPDNVVMQVLTTPDGCCYVCTYGLGISRIDSDSLLTDHLTFETILNRDYPAGDAASTAQADSAGRIWTVSEGGITRYNPATGILDYYDSTDFDRAYTLGEAKPLLLPRGLMLVGGQGGFMAFDTRTLHKSDFCPYIAFTGVKYPGDGTDRIDCNDMDTLTLSSDHRSVSIQFAALDYRPSRLMRYAYMMDGVDADWSYTTAPEVNYINLPAGDLHLLVRATNSDGVWCANQRRLCIRVEPTFWETPWAWLVYLLAAIAVIAVAVSLYTYIYKLRQNVYIERRMAAVKLNFFTDVSHELRTPLTLIDGPLGDVLEQEPLSKRARGHLELARKNASRMLNLVNQILDFRKVQTHHVRLTLKWQDLLPLVHRTMGYFDDMARTRRIDYALECTAASLMLWLDDDKVEKILLNLLSNAFKYTDEGRSIHVRIAQTADGIQLSVADQGCGIEPEQLNSIFSRFVALSNPSDMQPSTGIGLSLVKELVQLHHARVDVTSRVGQGSTFTVLLPESREVYAGDPMVDFVLGDTTEDTEGTKGSGRTEDTAPHDTTLLVVEDNDELRQFIVSILEDKYRILQAVNGREGLEKVRTEEVDFILTDVMMPIMDGMEMIRTIKQDPLICHVPIVVLSAKTSIDDRIEGLENGIDDYLTKPFSATYLRARVESLLQQRHLLRQSFLAGVMGHPSPQPAEGTERHTPPVAQIEMQAPQVIDYDKQFVADVMAYFEQHMSDPDLSVADFADAVNMSRTSFYRKLKAVLGLTPVDFIRQIRIRRAVQLINAGEDSLSQIAYQVGFADPKYFSKCFKRDMGMPPVEYKQKVQAAKAAPADDRQP